MTSRVDMSQIPPEIESLSRMASKLFDLWNVPDADRAKLLGMGSDEMQGSSQAADALVFTGETRERLGHLMAMHKALRILFPCDRQLAYSWVNSPNKAFESKRPIEVMVEQGDAGFKVVRRYLEHSCNHL